MRRISCSSSQVPKAKITRKCTYGLRSTTCNRKWWASCTLQEREPARKLLLCLRKQTRCTDSTFRAVGALHHNTPTKQHPRGCSHPRRLCRSRLGHNLRRRPSTVDSRHTHRCPPTTPRLPNSLSRLQPRASSSSCFSGLPCMAMAIWPPGTHGKNIEMAPPNRWAPQEHISALAGRPCGLHPILLAPWTRPMRLVSHPTPWYPRHEVGPPWRGRRTCS
mmetsp:Transcript_3077/g.7347  ORF Transcript_3077/g.7347 Transcript_3077/m.7347 type:complete len:219 (+) Transcript_3077:1133-1789(+)